MCDIEFSSWDELKSTFAAEMLSGDFPKCGIKFTSKHGVGLVLAAAHAPFDQIVKKAKAAHPDKSYVFMIPEKVARIYGINIPTLMDIAS